MSLLLYLLIPLLNLFGLTGSQENYIANTKDRNAEGTACAGRRHAGWPMGNVPGKLPDGWLDEPVLPPVLRSKNYANWHNNTQNCLIVSLLRCRQVPVVASTVSCTPETTQYRLIDQRL